MRINKSFNICHYSISNCSFLTRAIGFTKRVMSTLSSNIHTKYSNAIRDLNNLQSNLESVRLANFNDPNEKFLSFKKLIELAGLTNELNKLKVIHIAGTKGKGSTCVFIENILRRNGIITGFYNSPHLISVNERIQVNGAPISHEKFANYFYDIHDLLKQLSEQNQVPLPSYFSFLTILAFHVFVMEKVDCAIIEVGIGGEYDPTNVIERPIVCGITTLDYDHTSMLSNKIEGIARTKAGICKLGVPLFTVDQSSHPSTLDVILTRANETKSPMYVCKPLINLSNDQLGIKGSAQLSNAALACHISSYFLSGHERRPIDVITTTQTNRSQLLELACDYKGLSRTFQDGITKCTWPGRCQTLKMSDNLIFFLDGAHTIESMKNCIHWYKENSCPPSGDVCKVVLVNIVGDRDREKILYPLVEYQSFDYVIFSSNVVGEKSYQIRDEAYSPGKRDNLMSNTNLNMIAWTNVSKTLVKNKEPISLLLPTIEEFMRFFNELVTKEYYKKIEVLVTGSLHFVGAVMKVVDKHKEKS